MPIKPPAQKVAEDVTLYPDGEGFVARWPNLFEWIVNPRYEDGSARETSTLVLSYEHPSFKACLNDRDGERSLFVSGAAPYAVLDRLEAMLVSDGPEWRAWRNVKGKRPRKDA